MPGKEKKVAPKTATKAAAPIKKAPVETSKFAARAKDFGIGRDVPYARDISRFMRWPHFVTMQRKKRVLQRRLKTPPALAQFRKVLDRTTRTSVFKLLKKYAPETRKERNARIKAAAESKTKDAKKTVATKAPLSVISGIQEVTRAIEKKQAKLVIIASDVDPIELVLWMPALCRANKIPYAIVKDTVIAFEEFLTKTDLDEILLKLNDQKGKGEPLDELLQIKICGMVFNLAKRTIFQQTNLLMRFISSNLEAILNSIAQPRALSIRTILSRNLQGGTSPSDNPLANLTAENLFTSDTQVVLKPTDSLWTSVDGSKGTTLQMESESLKPMNLSLAFP